VKTGKQRKDKFYHLAKESGYRARSAFKLIQLNRKFGFLQESRVLVDLCAAPGGWLQVAANNMPVSSIVVGIDLVPIKSIPNVTTFQADITTDHCKELLKKELKTWKADVFLNDGAPNVGTAWIHDAFTQAQLALSALKLASEYLRKGGWFITKLFRSKDYTALLWVFEQLFKKVHSTKPQASRNESAEIFVVCQGYLAPDKLDERFLNPKHVFQQIEQESKVKLDILRPEKQTRQREGYADNNVSLHTTVTAKDFIESSDAVSFLSTANKIDIKQSEIKDHPATTTEIAQCCLDIKVLGKKELKALLAWRKKVRKDLLKSNEAAPTAVVEEVPVEETEEEKQEELDHVISELKSQEDKEIKKKKKRVREVKKKMRERLASKLEVAGEDEGIQEQDLFALNLMKNKQDLETVDGIEPDNVGEEEESDLEMESGEEDSDESEDSDAYVYGDDELYEKPPKKGIVAEEPKMKKRKKMDTSENPLLVEMEEGGERSDEAASAVKKAKQWYQKDTFKDVDDKDNEEVDDDYDIEQMLLNFKKKGGKVLEKAPESTETQGEDEKMAEENEVDGASDKEEDVEEEEKISSDEGSETEDEEDSDSDYESEIDDRSISVGKTKDKPSEGKTKEEKKSGFEVVEQGYLGPEELAMGTAMATSKKRKRDMIEMAYNRYTFNDDNLPAWFTDDENKHTYRHVPVTREEVEVYKQRQRELNARPIKKVIEAKAKKKSKMLSKLNRARKKAQGILDSTEVSAREQQDQIKGIYKKAGLLKKKHVKPTFVVAKKSLAGKKYRRPEGVKGTYKVVDPRMKNDLRAAKNKEKTKGRKGKKKR